MGSTDAPWDRGFSAFLSIGQHGRRKNCARLAEPDGRAGVGVWSVSQNPWRDHRASVDGKAARNVAPDEMRHPQRELRTARADGELAAPMVVAGEGVHLHFHCVVIDGVFDAAAAGAVIFHVATGLASVQADVDRSAPGPPCP